MVVRSGGPSGPRLTSGSPPCRRKRCPASTPLVGVLGIWPHADNKPRRRSGTKTLSDLQGSLPKMAKALGATRYNMGACGRLSFCADFCTRHCRATWNVWPSSGHASGDYHRDPGPWTFTRSKTHKARDTIIAKTTIQQHKHGTSKAEVRTAAEARGLAETTRPCRNTERTTDRTIDRPCVRSTVRPFDRSTIRPSDRTYDRPTDGPHDRPAESPWS